MGDEAGCAAKKGVVTSVNRGKVYFIAWSMDVKFEGDNVVRHLDMTTHNHASPATNTPPWAHVDTGVFATSEDCEEEREREKKACEDYKSGGDPCADAGLDGPKVQSFDEAKAAGFAGPSEWANEMSKRAAANKCISARRCRLVPYKPDGCCKSQTADHLIPKSSFFVNSVKDGEKVAGWDGVPGYNKDKAPCICAEGASNTVGSHGLRHAHHKANGPGDGEYHSFNKEAELAAQGAEDVFKSSGCSKECIQAQLKAGHKGMGDQRRSVKHYLLAVTWIMMTSWMKRQLSHLK